MHVCLGNPNALFECAATHDKEHGHSAREGKGTIQQDPSGQTEWANLSWLLNIETLYLSDVVLRAAHAISTCMLYMSWELGMEEHVSWCVLTWLINAPVTSNPWQAARGCEYFITPTWLALFRDGTWKSNSSRSQDRRELSSCLTCWLLSASSCSLCDYSHEVNPFQQLLTLSLY